MKERPILFSAPMVRAVLDGHKTQTRRILKPPRGYTWHDIDAGTMVNSGGHKKHISDPSYPYGQPGDRLWVRETWADLTVTHGRRWEKWNAETKRYDSGVHPFVWYRADGDMPDIGNGDTSYASWRPSIFMPRWACRIFLEVVAVRVERLKDISPADASAEGIIQQNTTKWFSVPGISGVGTTARAAYALLWNSINGPGSWDANQLVWVVEFNKSARPHLRV